MNNEITITLSLSQAQFIVNVLATTPLPYLEVRPIIGVILDAVPTGEKIVQQQVEHLD